MTVPIDRIVRSRRRTIALIIEPDGALVVRAPQRMAAARILEFVASHADWIRKKQARARANPPPAPKRYLDGDTFLYLGKSYPLTIVPRQHPALTFKADRFRLARSAQPRGEGAFVRWYKQQALRVIAGRIQFFAGKCGARVGKIRITSARTRWGSCSTRGTLSFTWRLILAPPEVVDYVVVHELMHLQVKNHSKNFWQRVAAVLPAYQRSIAWLKQNGKFLTL